jgi:hypothetical protein
MLLESQPQPAMNITKSAEEIISQVSPYSEFQKVRDKRIRLTGKTTNPLYNKR